MIEASSSPTGRSSSTTMTTRLRTALSAILTPSRSRPVQTAGRGCLSCAIDGSWHDASSHSSQRCRYTPSASLRDRGRFEVTLRPSERTRDAEYERNSEHRESDERIDQPHVADPLDEESAADRADRIGRPREHHRDADHASEHVVRHDRLAQRAGVDVEQETEARAERPEHDSDRYP